MTKKERGRSRNLAPLISGRARRIVVAELLQRDGGDCFYCLRPMGADCTVEHLHRWADGGSNHPGNLALAHRACNWNTKDLTVDQKMLRRGDALLSRLREEERAAA